MAEQPGIKSVVFSDGVPGWAMPFMHNLGLSHGPDSQPNRISVMNGRIYISPDNGSAVELVDYQRFSLPALDENNLSEPAGIGVPAGSPAFYVSHWCENAMTRENTWLGYPGLHGAIDWDCDTTGPQLPDAVPEIDQAPVSADVNGDGVKTVLPATGNEWLALVYDAGGRIGH